MSLNSPLSIASLLIALLITACSKDDEKGDNNTDTNPNTNTITVDTAKPHLKYYGYLRTDAEKSYLNDVAGKVNIAEVKVEEYIKDLSFKEDFYEVYCITPIYSILDIFYTEVGGQYVYVRDFKLHWDYFVQKNASILNQQDKNMICVAEQPLKRGMSNEMLDSITTIVSSKLPQASLLLLVSAEQLNDIEVPDSIDYIGMMQFGVRDPNTDAAYQSNLDMLKNKMSNHQKLFIIMDAQWTPAHAEAGIDSTDMHTVAENYYKLANEEEDAIGILAYLWPSAYDDAQQVGMNDLPEDVREIVKAIGQAIMENYNPCED